MLGWPWDSQPFQARHTLLGTSMLAFGTRLSVACRPRCQGCPALDPQVSPANPHCRGKHGNHIISQHVCRLDTEGDFRATGLASLPTPVLPADGHPPRFLAGSVSCQAWNGWRVSAAWVEWPGKGSCFPPCMGGGQLACPDPRERHGSITRGGTWGLEAVGHAKTLLPHGDKTTSGE